MRSNAHSKRYKAAIRTLVFLGVSSAALVGCSAPTPPIDSHDICAVFQQYPQWYWDSLASYNHWGIPVSVQMAFVEQESSFQADARPPRTQLLGVIPWSRPTSAYGYSQALNGTWAHYLSETHRVDASRDNFADAVDFIGWYGNKINQKLKISKRDAYHLYLAYHEGISGYSQGSYKSQAWLLQVAQSVQSTANRYKTQLSYCYNKIPKPSVWNQWLR